ncbi:VOC family protein, partial [Streptomyces sp. SCA2-4]|nr:VOC family protein [Streptomyces huiliensis]
RYLELDGERPGAVAEGRVGVVADLDPAFQTARVTGHPNGAVGLVDVTLCADDAELDAVRERYERCLGRPARAEGRALVFGLAGASLTLVAGSALGTLLPGERAPALPALVAYTVAVDDPDVTRELLTDNGIPVRRTASGDLFVPAAAALGTAVVFRRADQPSAG